jgi:hypothetical protein
LRFNISLKIRLYKSEPLLYAAFNVSATLFHISQNCTADVSRDRKEYEILEVGQENLDVAVDRE